jgi:hypothetical protein
MGRTMLVDAGLPEAFWAEAIRSAVYLKNRLPSKSCPQGTFSAYEAFYGDKPALRGMHPFGCAAYVEIPRELRRKTLSQSKAKSAIFLGYVEGTTHQFRVYDTVKRMVIVDRDVSFIDDKRPARKDQKPLQWDADEILEPQPVPAVPLNMDEPAEPSASEPHTEPSTVEPALDEGESAFNTEPSIGIEPVLNEGESDSDYLSDPPSEPVHRRSTRLEKQPSKHWDFKRHGKDFVHFSKAENRFLGCPTSTAFTALGTDSPPVPQSAKEARRSSQAKQWEDAMAAELQACKDMQIWERIPYDQQTPTVKAKKHLRNRWVFKIKDEPNGSQKFKGRLVIKGYEQRYGEDFHETWASVATMASTRLLAAIGGQLGRKIYQMDVKNAFLNADLDEAILMCLPEGFDDGSGDLLLLRKSLYGLKQAPRQWFLCIDAKLRSIGFQPNSADPNLYLRRDCIFLLYVDDIWFIPFTDATLQEIRGALESWFKMTWLGEAKRFLGLDVEYLDDGSIALSQKKYVEEVLERFGMENCRPTTTPLIAGDQLPPIPPDASEPDPEAKRMYQRMVGSLMYAMVATRPDIAFAVSATGQFASNPQQEHWVAIRHILRYLKGSADFALVYPRQGNLKFEGFTDADWGGNRPDRRSTSGYVYLIGSTALSWSSTRQKSVSLSTTEAEYIASSGAAQELIWLRRLLKDVQNISLCPVPADHAVDLPSTPLHIDNQSAMSLTQTPEYRKRTKHIDISYHFVREKVASGEITVIWTPTDDMTADILTKALPPIKHDKHVEAMKLLPLPK